MARVVLILALVGVTGKGCPAGGGLFRVLRSDAGCVGPGNYTYSRVREVARAIGTVDPGTVRLPPAPAVTAPLRQSGPGGVDVPNLQLELRPDTPDLIPPKPPAAVPEVLQHRFYVRALGVAGPLPAAFITVGPMKIEQMGVVIRSNGDFIASARCLHNGGANGELRSSHLRLTYTFYAGASPDAPLPGATAVWQTTRNLRVYATRPEQFTAFEPKNAFVQRNFPVITHVVVKAEFLLDE